MRYNLQDQIVPVKGLWGDFSYQGLNNRRYSYAIQ